MIHTIPNSSEMILKCPEIKVIGSHIAMARYLHRCQSSFTWRKHLLPLPQALGPRLQHGADGRENILIPLGSKHSKPECLYFLLDVSIQ